MNDETSGNGEGSELASIDTSLKVQGARREAGARTPTADRPALEQAVLRAVAYSDIFDYPLKAGEIHRYLIEVSASRADVRATLDNGGLVPGRLSVRDGFVALTGREATIETRQQRMEEARGAWAQAYRYGRIIASLPFVRMVAVTGELAMDNVGPWSDIDYFIVTEPGRLWFSRLLVVGVVRVAALRGLEVCPNYFLSERSLEFDDRNLYTAHEVAQMVPIYGLETYRRLRKLNPWVEDYLPNAGDAPRSIEIPVYGGGMRRIVEAVMRTRAGDLVERWEMNRKIRKLTGNAANSETAYSPDWCKGHVDGHGERVLALVSERWQAVKATMQ